MYQSFFGLQQEPFSIAPDPRFLYMSDKHREALALLNYGLNRGAGFVLLTGEIGAGKTTVWRRFLEELPSNFDVASVVNPKLDTQALIARICEDLHLESPPDQVPIDMIDALHSHLLLAHAMGRRTLIVIDEAQALSSDVLEQLRLLTNLDSSGRKLQVMLIGQPELRQMLQQPQLEPVAQRVVARYHLPALSESETAGYIAHRLAVAGLRGPMPFDGESIGLVHRLSGGVPRRINVICDRALANAMSAGNRLVDRHVLLRALHDVYGNASGPPVRKPMAQARPGRAWAMAGVAAVALVVGMLAAPSLETLWSAAIAARVSAASLTSATASPRPPALATVAAIAPDAAAASVVPPSAALVAAPRNAAPAMTAMAVLPLPTTAAAAKPAIPVTALDAIFAPAAADETAALRRLAGLWDTTLGPGEPCAAALARSLRCLRIRGGIASIRQLDRPGVLRLVDERGRVAHALLIGAGGDQATLNLGGADVMVPLAELARVWRGDFATFWRAPLTYREGDVATGTVEGAAWVAERLAAIDGGAGLAPGKDALHGRIAAFQLAHGLTPDGLAGPLTLMQLARAGPDTEPRLAR
ncbi:MAG TPA: AAA family ATPase [Caldimonas sp.]|jgi:general secretion pathway protein A